jgi:hypothetical protein
MECVYIVVKLNRINRRREKVSIRDDLANYLGISKRSISKYIQALCEAGILKKLGKVGRNGNVLYAIGFFMPYPPGKDGRKGGTNRIYFLTQLPNPEKVLCNLNLQF